MKAIFKARVLLLLCCFLYFGSNFAEEAIFISSSQNLAERGKTGSKQSGLYEEGMAKAMSDEEDRSGEAAAGRIPDELMKVADQEPVQLKAATEEAFQEGQPLHVALTVKIENGWYAYWKNPGTLGMPLQLDWNLPEGWEVEKVEWPTPKKLGDDHTLVFGYDEDFTLLATLVSKNKATPLKDPILVSARYVVCSKEQCLPGEVEATLDPQESQKDGSSFAAYRAKLPSKSEKVTVERVGNILTLRLEELSVQGNDHIFFFPAQMEHIALDAKFLQTVRDDKGFGVIFQELKKESVLEGVLTVSKMVDGKRIKQSFEISSPIQDLESNEIVAMATIGELTTHQDLTTSSFFYQFILSIVLAFLGGILLNLMPCVLPVLSLKVLGFVEMAKESRRESFTQALVFSLGVIVSFWVLAGTLILLKSYGAAVGWGFQLQQPLFVAFLILLIFLFGLSLFGVFELGTSLTAKAGKLERKASKGKSAYAGSFFNGVLACAVATPCTGPFLGSAIGFAVTLPAIYAIIVFTSLGIGMASPYLLLGAFPEWFRFLPKPGNWMITLKEVTGFCMMATCLWLLWVFSAETAETSQILLLVALFLIAIAAWILGKWGSPVRPPLTRRIGRVIAILLIGLSFSIATGASQLAPEEHVSSEVASIEEWEVFSPEKVASLRNEGKPVFIDFTSKWCLICQANHAILSLPSVKEKMREAGVIKMKADWTNSDPVITHELKKHGRNSVPLYLFFGKEDEPLVLPQILTPDTIMHTLDNHL